MKNLNSKQEDAYATFETKSLEKTKEGSKQKEKGLSKEAHESSVAHVQQDVDLGSRDAEVRNDADRDEPSTETEEAQTPKEPEVTYSCYMCAKKITSSEDLWSLYFLGTVPILNKRAPRIHGQKEVPGCEKCTIKYLGNKPVKEAVYLLRAQDEKGIWENVRFSTFVPDLQIKARAFAKKYPNRKVKIVAVRLDHDEEISF